MKQFIGMIEVLGEGGELQPLLWNPSHLVDGRALLIVEEPENRIWVWLGRGTTLVQKTTALRQARFIMRNGILVANETIGSKCTEFIEVQDSLKGSHLEPLRKLLEMYPKASDYLIVIEDEISATTVDETFQRRVEIFEQTISPEPTPKPIRARRRILSYEEQLSCKVLFAVTDVYGQASIEPQGPSEFEVTGPRLKLRFYCQGEEILFSLFQAAAQDDIDAFVKAFGQYPQLIATGQQVIDTAFADTATTAKPDSLESKPMSVAERMRKRLAEIKPLSEKTDASESLTETDEEQTNDEDDNSGDDKPNNDPHSDNPTEEYDLFS